MTATPDTAADATAQRRPAPRRHWTTKMLVAVLVGTTVAVSIHGMLFADVRLAERIALGVVHAMLLALELVAAAYIFGPASTVTTAAATVGTQPRS